MPKLEFRLIAPDDLSDLDLPLEIRTQELTLVARVHASQEVDLPTGDYLVSARLPGGESRLEQVSLGPEGTVCEFQLAAARPERTRVEDDAAGLRSEVLRSGRERPAVPRMNRLATSVLESVGPPGRWLERGFYQWRGPRLRLLEGDLLTGTTESASVDFLNVLSGQRGQRVEVRVDGGQGVRWLQLETLQKPLLTLAIPAAAGSSATAVVQRIAAGRFTVDLHPQQPEADLLLGYWQAGAPADVLAICESRCLDFERLIDTERPDLAAIVLYARLRFGDTSSFDRLAEWSVRLSEAFSWLPDGNAIRGEVAARRGDHSTAVTAFLRLARSGLPIVSEGLFMTVRRLRFYASLGAASPGDGNAVKDSIARLTPFVQAAEPRRLLLTLEHSEAVAGDRGESLSRTFGPAGVPSQVLDLRPWFAIKAQGGR